MDLAHSPVVAALRPLRPVATSVAGHFQRVYDARRADPIRPIRRYEFDAAAKLHPYHRGRWQYTSVACGVAGDLIRRHSLRTALELGPKLRPVIHGADVMDLHAQTDLQCDGTVVLHDATRVPWPVPDYDLFVAMQVFEHLGTSQQAVFAEVCRVARHAIISLPIGWTLPDPSNCHHGITHAKALTWFAPITPTQVVVGNGGPRKRLIYVFEDLPQSNKPEP